MVPRAFRFLAVWLMTFPCLFGQQPSPPTAPDETSTSVVLRLDGPSEVFIDGEKVGTSQSPGIRKFVVSPGEHFLEVKSNGRVWGKKVSVAAGTQVAEEVRFAPAESKGSAPDSGKSKSLSRATAKPGPSATPLDPEHFNVRAPAVFKAKFTTTKGEFVVEVHRDWAPNGADRFYNLVRSGFYRDASFFRVVPKFVVQFGIAANPDVQAVWRSATIKDDPAIQSNKRGFVSLAGSMKPNSRSTQVFINLADNPSIDKQGFSPFGSVIDGIGVVDSLYDGYGEIQWPFAGSGQGPSPERLAREGKSYVDQEFPKLDRIISTLVIDDPSPAVVASRPATRVPRPIKGGETSIRDEVARIQKGQHSTLPPAIASPLDSNASFGSIQRTVENGTAYTLTVLFAGPVERRITLAPGKIKQLALPPGTYKVAAHVSASNVLPFFGFQSYSLGQGYTSHFDIK
jgi:peptidyl-prolyl cis-trans isomerase A (cyclophilin A)